ncbi:AIPR family protein [Bacteroides sp.]|uniref:AIPR family protein n=1 Tax=Bacteroides sp. TaxID=29523 RepID=UPI002FCAC272
MDIEEYRIEFLNTIRNEASIEGTDVDDLFVSSTLLQLEEMGEVVDPYPFSCEMRGSKNRLLGFDAYGYDDADSSIILFISDFQNTAEKTTLTNSRITELYNKMRYFIEEIMSGSLRKYCDDSSPVLDIAREFKSRIGTGTLSSSVLKFKFYILTNSVLSVQVKTISQEELLERPVELNLWTLERFYQAKLSNSFESIKITCGDFGCDGIQCLKANIGDSSSYDSYMAIVPGRFLADIYLKYGSRLLEGNVRAFLSIKAPVNKEIRKTIIGDTPENFFTYNNGIAVVAHSITLSEDKTKIIAFDDFQIINGGQTTASLASVIIKKEVSACNFSKIFVPMKLTVFNVENDMTEEEEAKYNQITQQISRSANNQTAVKKADFFSNDPFHILMEQLSLKCLAPPVGSSPHQTVWYYERSSGRWGQEQMKMSEPERNKFKLRSPKNQVVSKEKLAKCLNAIMQNPYEVCAGSAKNMMAFATVIIDIYEKSKDDINEVFFKKAIASIILFDDADKIVNKSPWYPKGGNKAQIVPYTISKIIQLLPKDYDIDWVRIWQKQMLYSELAHQIEIIAEKAHEFLLKSEGVIVREYSKKAATWKKFSDDASIVLTDEFVSTLINKSILKAEVKAAAKARRFNKDIDLEVEFYTKGYEYWMSLYNDLEREALLSSGDRDFVKSIASYINRGSLPSKAQIKRLLKIIYKAEDAGYIMPA